jgi:hypothetical protein
MGLVHYHDGRTKMGIIMTSRLPSIVEADAFHILEPRKPASASNFPLALRIPVDIGFSDAQLLDRIEKVLYTLLYDRFEMGSATQVSRR